MKKLMIKARAQMKSLPTSGCGKNWDSDCGINARGG